MSQLSGGDNNQAFLTQAQQRAMALLVTGVRNANWQFFNLDTRQILDEIGVRLQHIDDLTDASTIASQVLRSQDSITALNDAFEMLKAQVEDEDTGLAITYDIAVEALEKGNEAFDLGNTAKTKAETAQTSADSAQTKADLADTKADTAQATGEAAQVSADAVAIEAAAAAGVASGAAAEASAATEQIGNIYIALAAIFAALLLLGFTSSGTPVDESSNPDALTSKVTALQA